MGDNVYLGDRDGVRTPMQWTADRNAGFSRADGFALVPAVVTGFVSMTVVGFLLLPALPIVLKLVGRRSGDAESTAAGLEWLSGDLGGLVVTLVVGLLVGQPGAGLRSPAPSSASLAVPGVWLLRPHLREPAGDAGPSGRRLALTDR